MRDRREFTLDVVSGVDDDIVDRNLQKRARLWNRKDAGRARRFVPWIAAAACLCLIVGAFLWLLPGIGKQVPVYLGMTVADSPNGSTLAIEPEGMPLSVISNLTPISYAPSPVVDGEVQAVPLKGKGSNAPEAFGGNYYAMKNEDVYIHIHISNPDKFEILSFTLNGVKYSSYMFEAGSDMETLILKYNVGDVNGLQEYTIDAIKYVDGEKIKDVRMEGDRTVRVYVNDDNAALQLNATVSVDTVIIAPTRELLSLALYEGDTLIRELSPTDRRITGLPMGKRLVLVATYKNGETIETVRHSFDTPATSQGLEIEDGVIVGIGDCLDTVLYINQPIAAEAFKEQARIKEVYLGSGVTLIGASAFENCPELKTVVLPDTLTSIGDHAFQNCTSLTEIVIPDSVISIGTYAFSGCTSLTEIVIPDGLTSIGDYAFYGSSNLKRIEIPDSVTAIGASAFQGCSSLTEIVIPDSVTSIGAGAFSHCTSLTEIVIPNSVPSIGAGAFSYCSSLSEIVIPNGVTSINWFSHCTSLTEIVIPDSVTSIGNGAFQGCSSLTEIVIPDGVTSIGNAAFSFCAALTEIELPDSITSIGDYAFYGSSNLKRIEMPDEVTSIGEMLFRECSALEEIVIPDGVTSIGSGMFAGCASLTKIVIPDSVTLLDTEAFQGCGEIRNITLPKMSPQLSSPTYNPRFSVTDVYYGGTKADWREQYQNSYFPITVTGVVHCSDGDITH